MKRYTSYGQRDIFIVKYDNAGNCLWVKQAGGIYTESGKGISESANGYVYVTGIGAEVNFGNINIINSAIFVAKISKSTILTITSPTGGENWQTNSQHNITWNSVDDGNIKIEITTNNGTDWFTLQASVAANLGNYTLTVPPFSTSSQCMIRLTSLSYGNVSTSSAITITSASVPNVTITSPNTYVKWNAGSSQNITWTLTGSVDNVKLEYTTENGTGWNTITNSTSASAQSYAWVVPNAPSTSCRIRVSDATNSALNDVSDVLFTIANITTTAPSGGEQWKSGTNKSITWTSTGVANVNLFYSTNSGIDWIAITSNITASTASYSWTVPSVTSAACKIKIADAFDATLFSLSNVFSIWQPLVSTHTPSTGTITQNFDLTNIDFSAFVLVADAITTTFYPYEAPQTGTLPGGVVGASQYYWLITSASVSFFNGVISVPLASLTGVTDATKLVWLKRTNSGDAWTNIGGSVSAGNLLSTVAFSSFSEFAIGTTDAVNPLPVELISFSKIIKDKKVILNWQTATEVNNYGFEIEKTVVSSQKSEWGKVGFVQGHGNSNSVKDYSFVDEPVTSGKYYYRLKQMDNDGKFKYSKEIEVEVNLLPTEYTLDQNFPNPFNPSTVIKYVLPFESNVKLLVYNLIGEVIKELVNETVSTGYQEVSFDAGKLSSGIYFYTLIATSLDGKQNYQSVKKMLLLK